MIPIHLLLFLLVCGFGSSYRLQYDYDKDEPLFLTPYITSGQLERGKAAAQVHLNIESYSGFLTVNETSNKNLFFWYFPANQTREVQTSSTVHEKQIECVIDKYGEMCQEKIHYDSQTTHNDVPPVVLWLQGGPGASSMYGLLLEHGPIQLNHDGSVHRRGYTWSKNCHMLYIDSPVGTGFSFGDQYDHDETQVSQDLYQALLQFFKLFSIKSNEFFIAGESYAGRYIPALGRAIHRNNPSADTKINLKGLLIGDGMVDDKFMIYGDYLAQHGLIDLQDLPTWLEKEKKYKEALNNKDLTTAYALNAEFFKGMTDTGVSPYNFLKNPSLDAELKLLSKFFDGEDVRRIIHVGNLPFNAENYYVYKLLWRGDFFMKVSPYTEELLENNYRIMHYNGQLDIICHFPMAEEYTNQLQWRGSQEFQEADTKTWCGKKEQHSAGTVKSGGNLTLVMVRNAGHMVPQDQPKWAFDLMNHFIQNELDKLVCWE